MNYLEYFHQIPDLYTKISPKITQLEKLLGIIFLKELQIISDIRGNVVDIVLLLGDIEGFSYQSKPHTLLLIKFIAKFFSFPAFSSAQGFVMDFLDKDFSRGIDQYHGISLLTNEVVCYYGIIGWIRPEYDSVNVNFYSSAINRVQEFFPTLKIYENFRPLGSFYLGFVGNTISEKRLYTYDLNPNLFQQNTRSQLCSIVDPRIQWYVRTFSELDVRDYWKEYISWSWENEETGEKFYLSEFFLKSQKRTQILKHIDQELWNSHFLDAYICEISTAKQYFKTWFLIKESYEQRKQKGLYNHQSNF